MWIVRFKDGTWTKVSDGEAVNFFIVHKDEIKSIERD